MRRRTEFSAAVRTGRRAGTRALTLHLAPMPGDSPAHVGFVVPRAVGTAVVRNQVRRRLRHLLRDRLLALPAGSALVVRVGPPAAGYTSAELARALDGALGRLGLTHDISRVAP
jgi:ribonuclease P protein component